MKFQVELLAFGEPGEIREVEVPDDEMVDLVTEDDVYQAVYRHGQNDNNPQSHPSISTGDVICETDSKVLICPVGFKKLTNIEYIGYLGMSQRDRRRHCFTPFVEAVRNKKG